MYQPLIKSHPHPAIITQVLSASEGGEEGWKEKEAVVAYLEAS